MEGTGKVVMHRTMKKGSWLQVAYHYLIVTVQIPKEKENKERSQWKARSM